MTSLPDLLVVTLARYSQIHRNGRAAGPATKINTRVQIPLHLDMSTHFEGSTEDKLQQNYTLCGVVCHTGVTPNAGHYRAYVRMTHPDNRSVQSWFQFDDLHENALKLASPRWYEDHNVEQQVYVLIFEKPGLQSHTDADVNRTEESSDGGGVAGAEVVIFGEKDTMHPMSSKEPSGVLREGGEVGAHNITARGARRVVATTEVPLGGGAAPGVPLRECQEATNVLGRAREAQQRVRQSRMIGGRGDGEGEQRAWSHPLSSAALGEGQLCDTEEITERQFRAGSSGVWSGPQERQNKCTQGAGTEEDGTLPLGRQSQSSRRVTFTLWVEGTGTEVEEGHTKTTVTKSERSLQCMEDASATKQTWTQHMQEAEEAGGSLGAWTGG
jgi:hypothetical protein